MRMVVSIWSVSLQIKTENITSPRRLAWFPLDQLTSIRQMSRQVSCGSAGEYQADEQAGVAGLS